MQKIVLKNSTDLLSILLKSSYSNKQKLQEKYFFD